MGMDESELKKKLTPEQYRVMRERGTEAPFSGRYVEPNEKGMFVCAACGNELFSSDTQFKTNMPKLRGWPSFEDAIPGSVELKTDDSMGMHRTEVLCKKCGSHLGHIFEDDKETKTGKHYCINSVCLDLKRKAGD